MQKISDEKDESLCSNGSCSCIESCDCQGICVCEPEEDLVAKQGACNDCSCGNKRAKSGCR